MKRSHATSLALVGLFLWQAGCTSFHRIPRASMVADYGEVEVRLYDGSKVKLAEPNIEKDSIRGRHRASSDGGRSARTPADTVVAFSLITQVSEVGVIQFSWGKTAALVVPIVLVGALVAVIASEYEGGCYGCIGGWERPGYH